MKPSENRKKKGPELEPVFVAGPDAFAADYTDFSRLLLLPFRSPRHPFTILGTARRLRWSGICDYLSYLRSKRIGIEPQMAQMTQIGTASIRAGRFRSALKPRPNPNCFTGGSGGRGEDELGGSETIHSPRITRISRICSPHPIRGSRDPAEARAIFTEGNKGNEEPALFPTASFPSLASVKIPHQSHEPQRHGGTKNEPQRMDRNPSFVPWCLRGESSGLNR
jgi:hypothetical protein